MGSGLSTTLSLPKSKNEFLSIIPVFEVEAKKPHDASDVANNPDKTLQELIELRSKVRNALEKGKVLLEGDEKVIQEALSKLLHTAITVEKSVTPFLRSVAKECGGELVGLFHRFKTRESLERKVKGDIEAKKRSLAREGRGCANVNVLNMVNSIGDALRYTILIPDDKYSEVVLRTREKLDEMGNVKHKFKNFWDEGDMYQGINDTYRNTQTNFVFELQFHTPGSWDMKAECHVIYEKFRVCPDPSEQQKLFEEGVRLAETLPIPPGVKSIPVLVKNPEPNVIAAYAYLIHTTGKKRHAALMEFFHKFVGDEGIVRVDVDDLPTIEAELVALMEINNHTIPVDELVRKRYFFGIRVVVSVCDASRFSFIAKRLLQAMQTSSDRLIPLSKQASTMSPPSVATALSRTNSGTVLAETTKGGPSPSDACDQAQPIDSVPALERTLQIETGPTINSHEVIGIDDLPVEAHCVYNHWTPVIAVQRNESGESDYDTLASLIAPGLYVECSIGSRKTLYPEDNLLFELTLTTEQAEEVAQRISTRHSMRISSHVKCNHQQYINEMIELWNSIQVPNELDKFIGCLLKEES